MVLIPEGSTAAQQQRQQQMLAAIQNLHLDIARGIYTELVSQEYFSAKAAAVKEANPFGVDSGDDGGPIQLRFDLAGPAIISKQAADAFLVVMGIIPDPNQKQGPSLQVTGD